MPNASLHLPVALIGVGEVPRRGLEPPRDINPTSTSSWRVCQFRHLGGGECAQYSPAGRHVETAPGLALRSPREAVSEL